VRFYLPLQAYKIFFKRSLSLLAYFIKKILAPFKPSFTFTGCLFSSFFSAFSSAEGLLVIRVCLKVNKNASASFALFFAGVFFKIMRFGIRPNLIFAYISLLFLASISFIASLTAVFSPLKKKLFQPAG